MRARHAPRLPSRATPTNLLRLRLCLPAAVPAGDAASGPPAGAGAAAGSSSGGGLAAQLPPEGLVLPSRPGPGAAAASASVLIATARSAAPLRGSCGAAKSRWTPAAGRLPLHRWPACCVGRVLGGGVGEGAVSAGRGGVVLEFD
jgi:hypothetical protein